MRLTEVPADVALEEELGRGVASSKGAARAKRSRVPFREFLPQSGETNISVDRLSVAPLNDALAIAEARDTARGRTFYGWVVVTAESAGENGRQVVASPVYDNPYHADIVLPQSVAQDRDSQKRHAQELADSSRWRGIPEQMT